MVKYHYVFDSHSNHQRIGLIRARMAGGQIARGPFMVLIDGHTKPHDEWLRPIVKLLREVCIVSAILILHPTGLVYILTRLR